MDYYSVWAEIDLAAVGHNVRSLKSLSGESCRLMAVVKADGYGHGMCRVAETALASGASALGVARLEEGIRLREQGLRAPILVMGYTPGRFGRELIDHHLIQTVWSESDARDLSRQAVAAGTALAVHFKVDTGMGRLGKNLVTGDARSGLAEAVREVLMISKLPGLSLEGVYTHFASADDPDQAYTRGQMDLFLSLVNQLQAAGLSGIVRHAANSAALINLPDTHLDMVRTGIAVYGLYPSVAVSRQKVRLSPAMTLKTRIVQLKRVPAGARVSYGSTYTSPRPTTLAVVPIGYGDGYNRLLSSKGHMLVSGQKAPVVGRICMDLTVLDVGAIAGVAVEDEVVVFGQQKDARISVDDMAAMLNTINYEIVSTVADRVPRVYV